MMEATDWKQERPSWCTHGDCVFLRRAMDSMCGGELSIPQEHNGGLNTHRFCINAEPLFDLMVNENDIDWLRWIFDALDGKQSSWLSRRKEPFPLVPDPKVLAANIEDTGGE